MDDLYENAWGDPLKDYSNQSYPLPTWNAQPSSPKLPSPVEDGRNDINVNDDGNEDLTTETQPRVGASGASWTADAAPWPVEENQNPFNPAWMSPANVWSSTGQPSTPTLSTPTPDDVPPQLPPLTPPTHPEEQSSDYLIPSQQAQDTPVQSRVPSPDQFGTFESGNADATIPVEVGWNSSEYSTFGGSVDPSDAWGQQAAAKAQNADAEPVDEWEAARRMKEKLDRRVPPEVVASIIETFEQFSEKMWPEGPSSVSQPQEEWLQSWRRSFDSVEGLSILIDTLLPEYTFAPRVPYANSAIAKEMNKSLRLTRHSAITRLSPMAHFMRTKGLSSDWEIAVKNRTDEVPDDMPVGWRIVEKKEETPAPAETKKRSGLFSSFWNRREGSTASLPSITDTKAPLVQDPPAESSPSKPPSAVDRTGTPPTVPLRTASESPSQSAEERKSQSTSSNRLTKLPPVITASVSASSTSTVSSATSTPVDATASPVDSTVTTDGPAQSAVSRFLNRFSRPKSTAGNHSLSLSSEDLDFLSDVPAPNTANGVTDEDDDVPLGKQKAIIESKQGAILATPLAATPLRPNTMTRPAPAIAEDDFDALFNTPVPQPKRAPLQTPSRPSSSISQRGAVRAPTTASQIDTPRNPTTPVRPHTPSFPVVRMSSTPSRSSSGAVPFLIPPPPASPFRPATPQPSTRPASPPTTTSVPTLLPPSPRKPPETSSLDDDEFSDFLSLSQPPPAVNGTHRRNTSSFSASIKLLGSFDLSNPITSSTNQQPIHQTSSGSSSLVVSPVSDTTDDTWGFDDPEDSTPATSAAVSLGHVSSITGTPPTKTAVNQLSASHQRLPKPSPPPPPVPSKSGSSTPSSLTSSPIIPPPKPQYGLRQRPPSIDVRGSDKTQLPRSRTHSRRVSAEDHSHTMQLMHNASKRSAWPAPLSPLPEALAPPPPPSSTVNSPVNTISSSKTLLDMNEEEPLPPPPEKSLSLNSAVSVIGPSEDGGGMNFSHRTSLGNGGFFSIPPPPGFTSRTSTAPAREQSLLDFGDFESPQTAIPKLAPRVGGKSDGGLSAQDLSFFEGL